MERKLLILAILFILALIIIFETDLGSELGFVDPTPEVEKMMPDGMDDGMDDGMLDDMDDDMMPDGMMNDGMPKEDMMP